MRREVHTHDCDSIVLCNWCTYLSICMHIYYDNTEHNNVYSHAVPVEITSNGVTTEVNDKPMEQSAKNPLGLFPFIIIPSLPIGLILPSILHYVF